MTPTTDGVYTDLDTIAAEGVGTICIANGSETLHLTTTGVAETPYLRVFDTRLFGEAATTTERVLIQSRTDPDEEWGSPHVHFRTEDGLTDGHLVILR